MTSRLSLTVGYLIMLVFWAARVTEPPKNDLGFWKSLTPVTETVEHGSYKSQRRKSHQGTWSVKGGKSIIDFIEDSDCYKFELIERGPTPEPLCQVMLHVGDLEHSIELYEKIFGMELLCKQDNPEYKMMFIKQLML